MVRGIIERHVKEGEDIIPLLREFRAAGMHQPGYITGETLISTEDRSTILVISTWHSLEHWKAWRDSQKRAELSQLVDPHLTESSMISIYEVLGTEE